MEELPPPYEVLLDKVRDVDGLLSLLTDRVDSALMAAVTKLRVISNLAVDYDNIDVAEATRLGILVGNTPGILTETTADFTFALLMGWPAVWLKPILIPDWVGGEPGGR